MRELEEKIEFLGTFLESVDFSALRRQSEEYLTEGKSVRFILYEENAKPGYQLKVDR